VDAPLARLHLLSRVLLVLCLSAAQLRTINTAHPDPVGAIVLWCCGFALFIGSGMHARTARLYLLLTFPTLLSLLLTWTLFNPVAGTMTLVRQQVYDGSLLFSLTCWQLVWLALVGTYYWWRRSLLMGGLLATILTIVLSRFVPLPSLPLARVAFFHPLTLFISDRSILIAITKVIGYSGMILSTVALVVTSRDVELIGALRQLRVPQPIVFFLSTVFRALNLALTDYETIHQAQIARAINARPRSFLRRVRDVGSIAVPMVAMMIRRSSEIGDALLARGYNLRIRSADLYETSPWRLLDWCVVIVCLVLFYMAVGPYPGLTALFQRWW
jgi:energy-coupling factor transporter transmembrane protein EcfT